MQQIEIDYESKWYAMATVSMGVFLATIDASIVNVAQPTLQQALNTSFALVQWVVLAYLLVLTTLMLSMGRLADILGKKQLYLVGFIVFTASSALCGLAPSVEWLIAGRIVQAVGAAMIMAIGPAIITESFPAAERGKALGIIGAVVSIGIVFGPVAGGLILQALSWHWIFFVNVPIGIIGSFMVIRFVVSITPDGNQRFDYSGAAIMCISLLLLLLGLTIGQEVGFAAPAVLALMGVSLIGFVVFVLVEQRVAQPMIDLDLFRVKPLSIGVLNGFLVFVLIGGLLYLMPFYLKHILHHDDLTTGLLLAALPIGLGITSPISGMLSDRFDTNIITLIGLIVLLVGFLFASTIDAHTTMVGYVVRFLPIGLGLGFFQSPNNSAILGVAPRHQLGIVSSMLGLSRTLGQTVGIPVLNALWVSRTMLATGDTFEGDVTLAPVDAQIMGLHETFIVIIAIQVLAVLLGLWLLFQQPAKQTQPEQPEHVIVP
ncbi:MAG: MFS transporter [Chloroflexaceae bacterium]|nr:MFS transporter [Chloroflexaceae bacterium]